MSRFNNLEATLQRFHQKVLIGLDDISDQLDIHLKLAIRRDNNTNELLTQISELLSLQKSQGSFDLQSVLQLIYRQNDINEKMMNVIDNLSTQLSSSSNENEKKLDVLITMVSSTQEQVSEINIKSNRLLQATNELLERYDKMPRTLIIRPKMSKPVDPNAPIIKKFYKFIKRNTYGRVCNLFWDETIISFICPITKRVVPCGPDGKGYVINIPTNLLRTIAPAFKWGLIFLKLALASQGLGGIVPSLDVESFASSPIDLDYLTSISAAVVDNNKFIATSIDNAAQNIIDALDAYDDSDFSQLDILLGNTSRLALDTAYDKIYDLLRQKEGLSYGAKLQRTGLEMVERINESGNPEYLWISEEGKYHYINYGLDPNNPYI
eukprot:CAMPEP_0196763294 /NCGR_PEP_ID=MMETSP1095-20130614/3768_1 /TAXON_ID=96789 ORGANISM="Chromulina nebulosa, Strain UTEXLB2642" /NCGR_SAMPLE_ID=MMETSP1095 /ASSEMBLY_ACC=CAM_ASM_000446 /LENGTH=379 /DNA_ID=CAMNT_0042116145 /DNA_START=1877 /DNA_END=3016 /DNA_ORIENTATION=-